MTMKREFLERKSPPSITIIRKTYSKKLHIAQKVSLNLLFRSKVRTQILTVRAMMIAYWVPLINKMKDYLNPTVSRNTWALRNIHQRWKTLLIASSLSNVKSSMKIENQSQSQIKKMNQANHAPLEISKRRISERIEVGGSDGIRPGNRSSEISERILWLARSSNIKRSRPQIAYLNLRASYK